MSLNYSSFLSFIFNFVILLPLIPKILITNHIYINPIEIILIFFIIVSFLFFKKDIFFHKIQRIFLFIFLIEIFFTLISFVNFFDISGFFKLIKYILYISVFYIGYKFLEWKNLKKIVLIGNIAMFINIGFYLYNISTNGFSIWNIKELSSGFINRYIDFSTMTFSVISSGAHAIWGDYCIFVFVMAIALFYMRQISFRGLLFTSILMLINLSISVARTSLLTFSIFLFLMINYHFIVTKKINKKIFYLGIIVILIGILLFVNFYDTLPMIKKIIYTIDSFLNSGQESNLVARYQVWIVSLYDLFLHPLHIFIGSGNNKEVFLSRINEANIYFNFTKYPGVPESFYLETLMYGGIFGLFLLIYFSFLVVYYSLTQKNILSKYFGFFFIAEIIVNLLSGAIMRSDLVLFHIMLLLGFIIRMRDEKKYITNNS